MLGIAGGEVKEKLGIYSPPPGNRALSTGVENAVEKARHAGTDVR